jgi:hypothetical protein
MLSSVRGLDGLERLQRPMAYQFWRAPTDNDRGGIEMHARWAWVLPRLPKLAVRHLPRMPFWLLKVLDAAAGLLSTEPISPLVSYRTLWQGEGWHQLRPYSAGANVDFRRDGSVVLRTATKLVDPGSGAERVSCRMDAHVLADGGLWMRMRCEVQTALPSVPRVGVRMGVREPFGHAVSWLGRGPHENYDDRKASAHVATHSLPASQWHVPYIVPGENGLRSDVQWLALRNATGEGVLLTGVPEMHVGVSPFSTEELDRATHAHELEPNGEVNVSVDHKHMGLGGVDSWSRTVYPDHCIPRGSYSWAIGMRSLAKGVDADEAAQDMLLAMPPPPA